MGVAGGCRAVESTDLMEIAEGWPAEPVWLFDILGPQGGGSGDSNEDLTVQWGEDRKPRVQVIF